MAAIYDALEEFVGQMTEEDPNFVVYPYHLSKYESVEDLPPPIETTDNLPNDIDGWIISHRLNHGSLVAILKQCF